MTTTTTPFSLFGILCSTLGHRFIISNKITNHINEYKCKRCDQEVTNVVSGDIEILTHRNRKINACLSKILKKNYNNLLDLLAIKSMNLFI